MGCLEWAEWAGVGPHPLPGKTRVAKCACWLFLSFPRSWCYLRHCRLDFRLSVGFEVSGRAWVAWSGLRGPEWASGRGRKHRTSPTQARAGAPKSLCLSLPYLTSTHFPALPSPDSPFHMPLVPCSHPRDMQDARAWLGKGAKP